MLFVEIDFLEKEIKFRALNFQFEIYFFLLPLVVIFFVGIQRNIRNFVCIENALLIVVDVDLRKIFL
jgi:hypothetical protein